ncbi:MAG: LPP20 family lipoprotein [Methylococcales bacterium]|nr:LPP20 family lipoprotein [Methylococcales bacterium]MDD5755300.1 LPP20 family lipoprotein [Methylococcales bacterium]
MNRYHFKPILFGAVLSATLSACTAMTSMSMTTHGANADEFVPEPKQLTATGYGTAEKSDKYSLSQIKLMAMRSSKLDAYRSLSEQVYGVRLSGVTTVENMIITHDSYKSYVDAYLRGAKVLRTVAINHDKYAGDDTFETVVAIELTPRFYECMNGSPAMVNQCMQIPVPPKDQPELLTPFSSAAPTVQIASVAIPTPAQCNSMDCYSYPLTSGFNRPLLITE